MVITVRIRIKIVRKMIFYDFPVALLSFCYSLMDACCLKRGLLPSTNISWCTRVFPHNGDNCYFHSLQKLLLFASNSGKVEPLVYVKVSRSSFHKSSPGSYPFKLPPTFCSVTSVDVFVMSLYIDISFYLYTQF